jgi:hypothetical protein
MESVAQGGLRKLDFKFLLPDGSCYVLGVPRALGQYLFFNDRRSLSHKSALAPSLNLF